ncbi:MAG: hypothetical protein ACKVJE_00395 [Pseudomonadales bacterium]
MNQLHESTQFHFFSDNSNIQPQPKLVTDLLTKLEDFELMPTYGQYLNAVSGEKRQFIILVSSDEKLRVEFQMDRIVINIEELTLNDAYSKTASLLSSLNDVFPDKTGNRLSIVSNRLFQGDSEDYSELYKSLFTYHQAEPFEWDNRIAERIQLDGTDETLNCVSTIRRSNITAPFIFEGKPFDAAVIELDINTIPQNSNHRFSLSSSIDFLSQMLEVTNTSRDLLNRYFDK